MLSHRRDSVHASLKQNDLLKLKINKNKRLDVKVATEEENRQNAHTQVTSIRCTPDCIITHPVLLLRDLQAALTQHSPSSVDNCIVIILVQMSRGMSPAITVHIYSGTVHVEPL